MNKFYRRRFHAPATLLHGLAWCAECTMIWRHGLFMCWVGCWVRTRDGHWVEFSKGRKPQGRRRCSQKRNSVLTVFSARFNRLTENRFNRFWRDNAFKYWKTQNIENRECCFPYLHLGLHTQAHVWFCSQMRRWWWKSTTHVLHLVVSKTKYIHIYITLSHAASKF